MDWPCLSFAMTCNTCRRTSLRKTEGAWPGAWAGVGCGCCADGEVTHSSATTRATPYVAPGFLVRCSFSERGLSAEASAKAESRPLSRWCRYMRMSVETDREPGADATHRVGRSREPELG